MYMPLSAQYRYIVAAKDDLTGVTEASLLWKNNSKTLAKFFWEKIYCRYGAVGQVTTDNGPEVKGAFEELVRRMRIPHVTISPYNKHANGVVERGHFILREAIVKMCQGWQWSNQELPQTCRYSCICWSGYHKWSYWIFTLSSLTWSTPCTSIWSIWI
jgi:transposase InsO family protein